MDYLVSFHWNDHEWLNVHYRKLLQKITDHQIEQQPINEIIIYLKQRIGIWKQLSHYKEECRTQKERNSSKINDRQKQQNLNCKTFLKIGSPFKLLPFKAQKILKHARCFS